MRILKSLIIFMLVSATASAGTQDILKLSIHSVREKADLFTVNAEYLQFEKVESSFNQKIESLINEKISGFKKTSRDNWKARMETAKPGTEIPKSPPFYLNISWSPTQLNAQYISFVIRMEAYEGGANARQEIFAFNYDVKKSKEISVDGLLGNHDNYLGILSFYTIDSLMERLIGEGVGNADIMRNLIIQGAGPKLENFRNFTFTDRTVNLFYSKAQVAPGYFGEQMVHAPMSVFSGDHQPVKHGLVIASIESGEEVNFPLKVDGQVLSEEGGLSWVIFEGEAGSIHVLDEHGQELGMAILKAQEDWMTETPVKVSGMINLEKSGSGNIYMEIKENYPGNARRPYTMIIPLTIASR
jgi:hypothetical protein